MVRKKVQEFLPGGGSAGARIRAYFAIGGTEHAPANVRFLPLQPVAFKLPFGRGKNGSDYRPGGPGSQFKEY